MVEVTVIIPAYNASQTISRAIASLMAQTIPVEIVVVDDGSPEPLKIDGVKVIRQKNAGGYAARRRGLQEVKTPYFGFMDADDWIEPTMYEKMLVAAKEHDLDVVQCDVYGAADRGLRVVEDLKSEVFDPILIKGTVASFVWDKLYRNRGIRLEPSTIMMYDDLAMNLQLFDGIKRFGYLHEGLYHYEVNAGSSIRNFKKKNIDDLKTAIAFREKYLPRYEHNLTGDMLHDWIERNFRNFFLVAASSKSESWSARMEKVKMLYAEMGRELPRFVSLRVFVVWLMMNVRWRLRG